MQSYSRCVQASKVRTLKIRVFCVNLANTMTNFGCIFLGVVFSDKVWSSIAGEIYFTCYLWQSFTDICFLFVKDLHRFCVFLWQSVDIAHRRDFFQVGSCSFPTEPSGDLLCLLPFFSLTKCDTWSIKGWNRIFFVEIM